MNGHTETERRAFPWVLPVALVLAAALWLPGLGGGFSRDDYALFAANEGPAHWSNTPLDLWNFFSGKPEEMRALIHRGALPWFTLPELKEALWRPLASALFALEHAVMGRRAVGYHVTQMLWFLGVVAAVGFLLRRAVPGALGALALLLFVVDDAHWDLVCLTCRYQMVALIPATLGLLAHLRWREEGWAPGLPLSLAGFAVGLLGGESALQMMAYVAGYELAGARDGWRARCRALLPAASLGVCYLVAYRLLGHGVYGRTGYLDPFGEPMAFLRQAGFKALAHVGNLFTAWPRFLFERLPINLGLSPAVFALLLLVLGLFLWLLRGAVAALPEGEARAVRWLVPGAVLSIIPGLAGPLVDRIILPASIGGAVAVAVVLRHGWRAVRGELAASGSRRAWIALVCGLTTVTHVVLAPIALPLLHLGVRRTGDWERRLLREAEVGVAQDVILLVAASGQMMTSVWGGWIRAFETGLTTRHWRVLTFREHDEQVLTRTAPDTFELAMSSGTVSRLGMEGVFRDPRRHPFLVGQHVAQEGMQVRVLEVHQGVATRFEVRLDRPLEDTSLAFLTVAPDGSLRRVQMPAVGERLRLPPRLAPRVEPEAVSLLRRFFPPGFQVDRRASIVPRLIPEHAGQGREAP